MKLKSIRHQITALFILILLFSVMITALLNGVFLEKYYLARKAEVLLDARTALASMDMDELMEVEELGDSNSDYWKNGDLDFGEEIGRSSSRNNLSWVVVTSDNSGVFSWGESAAWLQSKLFGYIFNLDGDMESRDVIRETEDCVVQKVYDRFAGMDYVECWGILDDGYYFLIRTPFESLRESAKISNRFYLGVGAIVALLSGVLVMFFVRRLTKPIDELTQLSREMASLNFDARYTSHTNNEIDVLGESFNIMSEQLENTISELKSANLELQKDIENKIRIDEQRKEFLDNVSHELKTPIALVQGYAEGLKENISEDPESREFYCDVIIDEASKMNKLVKNLLTLNQLESGKDAVVMERFELVTLIRGVLQSMDIMIRQNEAKVIFEQEEPVYVWGDEFKIEEVITNYISNALHHLGGDRQVEIRIADAGEKVRVSVFNNGMPIPEKDIPKLWEKFYKVDKARTREYGGSGIGLSIVKAIMESMHQEYGVKNYQNGVEFWFTLDRK